MNRIDANKLDKYAVMIVIALGLALTARNSTAQETQTEMATPVTVTTSPLYAVPDQVVTVSGTTAIDAPNPEVKISVTPPRSKSPISLLAKADSSGAFSIEFSATGNIGVYQVDARSPGGKGSATAKFAVMVPQELVKKVLTRTFAVANANVTLAQEAAQTITAIIEGMPDSPPQEALIRN